MMLSSSARSSLMMLAKATLISSLHSGHAAYIYRFVRKLPKNQTTSAERWINRGT